MSLMSMLINKLMNKATLRLTRFCTKCDAETKLNDFPIHGGRRLRHCRQCENQRHRDYRKKLVQEKADIINNLKRDINPQTGDLWRKGEKYTNGEFVWGYESISKITSITKKGDFLPVITYDLDGYINRHARHLVRTKHNNYNKNNSIYPCPVSITVEHLIDIFPKNLRCPIFNIEMSFAVGSGDYRIQLDRIDPTKGYVDGNVAWISAKANRSKSDATSEELYKIADWLKKRGH